MEDDEIAELMEVIAEQKAHYLEEIRKLKHAARLIHNRRNMVSGSLEMAECDAFCKKVGLRPWEWPL